MRRLATIAGFFWIAGCGSGSHSGASLAQNGRPALPLGIADPQPTSEPTESPAPSSTPASSPTASPTATSTPAPSATETPTPAASPTPTATPTATPAATPATNPIALENAKAGDAGMEVTTHAGPGQLEGYADATSINHGESIGIHVSADAAHLMTWKLYRVGYYAGAGARLFASGGPIAVAPQDKPAIDPATGFVECAWPVTFTIATQADWASGAFVLKLTRDDNKQSQVTFVVRADERTSAALVQIPVATWQAYNAWDGMSFYGSAIPLSNGQARRVSYDRPYVEGSGSGQLFRYDAFFLRWAEAQGYDVAYATSVDVSTRAGLLDGRKLFFSIGHDEYWTRAERDAVRSAIAAGTSVAFLSANDAYWQIRLEAGASGPARTEVCYKKAALTEDPERGTNLVTTQWRDPALNEPENALLGVMYTDYQLADMPWIVTGSTSWVYDGTGLRDGDTLPLIVGYETDAIANNGFSPANLTTLAASPILSRLGQAFTHNATVYPGPAGNFVFAAGTIQWSWGLSKPGVADLRVQRITTNLLTAAGYSAVTPGPIFGADHPPLPDLTGAAATISTVAGKAGNDGNTDGPATSARFRHPVAIAQDALGNLYVADTGNSRIRRIANDADHTVTTIAWGLDHPAGIAVGADGAIYVADTAGQRVVRIAPGATGWSTSHFAGSTIGESGKADGAATDARFNYPMGLVAVGADLFLADTFNHRIVRIDALGNVTTIAGGNGLGQTNGAGALAQFRYPTALTSGGGALWIDDTGNRLVRAVTLDAAYTTSLVAGQHVDDLPTGGFQDGSSDQALLMPQGGIAWTTDALYLADSGNGRIRRIANGVVRTFAGSGAAGSADGSGASASLGIPADILARPDGAFWIADQAGSTIRIVTP